MSEQVDHLVDDLVESAEILGAYYVYLNDGHGDLIAIEFNDDGDEIARYRVLIQLDKL